MAESVPGVDTVDAVLFDLDGTLVDSLQLIAQAMARVLVEDGIDTDPERLLPLIGPPMEVVARQLGVSPEESPRLGEAYLRLYHDQYVRQTPERAGASALIERLVAAGVALAIVTNKVEASARELLQIEGWTAHFGAVVGRDTPGAAAKPAPDPAWHALRLLGVAPERAAFVGDTEFDVRCGRAAGCRYAIGLEGHRAPDFLRAEGATHVFGTLEEVGTLLLGAPSGAGARP